MKWFRLFGLFFAFILVACSKPDPSVILGSWRAESFKLDSINLPIAPHFEMTRNELILKSPDGAILQKIPLAALRARDNIIEVELKDGFGISFEFLVESRDRIQFKVPLMPFSIVYNRT